jgi:hypothetical protein
LDGTRKKFSMNNRPRALAVLISIFLAGGIIGVAMGFFFWAKKQPEPPPFRQNAGNFRMPPGGPRGGRGNPWTQMLQLTPQQEKSIMPIMLEANRQLDALQKKYEPRYNEVGAEYEPQVRAIIDDRNRKFIAVLNEDQKKKFEEFQKRFEERMGRGGPGGERGGFGRPPRPHGDPSK